MSKLLTCGTLWIGKATPPGLESRFTVGLFFGYKVQEAISGYILYVRLGNMGHIHALISLFMC